MSRKTDLMKYTGSMQQEASIRTARYLEGRCSGLNVFEVTNGPMEFTVLADKCLDIGSLRWRGCNINFLSKPGLQGRGHYDTNGDEAIRSIMGGFFFTSGLENICAPCTVDGVDYPMHGRIRTTPGEHLCSDAFWEGDRYILRVSGEMREAALFGENMVLRRSIQTEYGSKTFTVTDEFENETFVNRPFMLLYHINLGYPFLDENLRLYIPTTQVTPRDEESKGHEGRYDRMDPPKDGEPEYVFIHEIHPDKQGFNEVLAVNEALGIGLKLRYSMENLPNFMEWKSTASGDYVIGLEPANSSVYGRPYHEKHGNVPMLEPFTAARNVLEYTFLDGCDEIEKAVQDWECRFGKK